MRPFMLGALAVLVAVPAGARAQASRLAPAFETAVSPWIGLSTFSVRQTLGENDASYRSTAAFGIRVETPLTQRVGVMASVGVAPFSKQRRDDNVGTELRDAVRLFSADVSLAWRFAARAPVFFYGGGGVLAASRPAYPDFGGSVLEPRAVAGVGFDQPSDGAWNFRIVAGGFLSFPTAPDATDWEGGAVAPPVEAKSPVMDWAVQVGGRYRLHHDG